MRNIDYDKVITLFSIGSTLIILGSLINYLGLFFIFSAPTLGLSGSILLYWTYLKCDHLDVRYEFIFRIGIGLVVISSLIFITGIGYAIENFVLSMISIYFIGISLILIHFSQVILTDRKVLKNIVFFFGDYPLSLFSDACTI